MFNFIIITAVILIILILYMLLLFNMKEFKELIKKHKKIELAIKGPKKKNMTDAGIVKTPTNLMMRELMK